MTAKKGIVNQGSEELPCITIDEIKLALRKTKNNKAPGEDNVVADTIKIGGPRLLEKITVLFNLCIYNSTIPDKWHNETEKLQTNKPSEPALQTVYKNNNRKT